MKKLFYYGLVILAIASVAIWYGFSSRNSASEQLPQIAKKPQTPVETQITEQERAIRDETARSLAAEFEAFLEDWKVSEMRISGDPATERAMVYARKLKAFDPVQQAIFASQILEKMDTSQKEYFDDLALYVRAVSVCQPGAGVLLLRQPPEEFKIPQKSAEFAKLQNAHSLALTTLATRAPAAALQWVIENKNQFAGFVRKDTQRWMVTYASKSDPEFGIRIAYEWFGGVSIDLLVDITMCATTHEQRVSVLNAARECTKKCNPGNSNQTTLDALAGILADGVVAEGFAPAMRWIEETNLTPSEINSFSSGLTSSKPEDALKWIDWIGKKLSPERAESAMLYVVLNWSAADYRAVAKWLENYRSGNLKNWAISAFVSKVAERDPHTAAIWAAKLPPGDLRNHAIGLVHRKWPKSDPKGAADFAIKHQINK